MATQSDIFSAFASAEALGRAIGVPGVTVRQWRNRGGNIPTKYWSAIRDAAEKQGHVLSFEAFLPLDALRP
ncbi:carph-isopro domain-containing protein [Sphingomonas endolithica]|uniref:carph-isopro domain-containing protein n=1 Tax=Sphingomonas endolithica TaxID=2972485 RepID=UPI003AABA2D8